MTQPFESPAPCRKCQGVGTITHKGFTSVEGKEYPDRTFGCPYCHGQKEFPGLKVSAILDLIMTKKGKVRTFRRSWPSKLNPWRNKDATVRRAYYVWRNARFHGGVDVTLPMTAISVTEGDPHHKVLDILADLVAKRVFGTDRAGASRWGTLLGIIKESDVPDGLPSSAYEGGMVLLDGGKPDFEAPELDGDYDSLTSEDADLIERVEPV